MSLQPLFTVQQMYYPAFLVLVNSSYDAKKRIEPVLKVTSTLRKIPRKQDLWGVRLEMGTPDDLDPITFPYFFSMTVYGSFRCDMPEKIEKEAYLLKRKLLYVNGSTVLYSAARDRLMLLTGGNPYPPYCLPAHRFNPDDIKDIKRKSS